MEQELVTVVIPVYKVQDYLERCVSSILKQTYKNLEIILVDDGSPDMCGEICEALAAIDYRVKVIHKSNGGLSDARNIGIANSHGQYIVFIDSDDYVSSDMIEVLYTNLKAFNADISVCMFAYVDEQNKIMSIEGNNTGNVRLISSEECLKRYYSKERTPYVVAWNKLYNMSLFSETRYPKGKIHEDEYTTYHLIYDSKKIVVIDKVLYFYFQRQGSITSGNLKIKHWDIWGAYQQSALFYQNKGLMDLYTEVRAKELCEIVFMYAQMQKVGQKDLERKQKILIKRYKSLFFYVLMSKKLDIKHTLESILFWISPKGYCWCKKMVGKIKRNG